jgi:hypothetical protein
MKLPHFVSGSAILLVGWLSVTFFRDVPPQRYQKLDKFPATASSAAPETSANTTGVFQVSNSH